MKTFAHFCQETVLVKKTILYDIKRYPQAETQLMMWYTEFSRQEFDNFNALKNVYGNAGIVNNNRVVFNKKGNSFRLVTSVNFVQSE